VNLLICLNDKKLCLYVVWLVCVSSLKFTCVQILCVCIAHRFSILCLSGVSLVIFMCLDYVMSNFFLNTSEKIGSEECLQNDLFCVE